MRALRFDVVCRVVDNYGDAGVGWRLARQLAAEHALDVRLWIDDLATLSRIAPGTVRDAAEQTSAGVRVHRLDDSSRLAPLPDVLVEGFGCGLPDAWVDAMATAPRPPLWINLEYLSAEAWIDGTHALPSPHPRLPLTRWFYFPGFGAASGGLLREQGLFSARDAFRRDASAQKAFWTSQGLAPPARGELAVSLFCYANAALPALFDAWAEGEAPLRVLVPEKVAVAALDRWTAGNVPHVGQRIVRGALTLAVVPFVSQDDFDRRLWACELDIVRGEDSFVRAQWAARPFVWQIYPQAEDAHRAKLDAFLARYTDGLAPAAAGALTTFSRAFDAENPVATAQGWEPLRAALPSLAGHALRWAEACARQSDLATRLVDFARSRL
jgi:uncharacterized repeat protein (TIGR03837 family)